MKEHASRCSRFSEIGEEPSAGCNGVSPRCVQCRESIDNKARWVCKGK